MTTKLVYLTLATSLVLNLWFALRPLCPPPGLGVSSSAATPQTPPDAQEPTQPKALPAAGVNAPVARPFSWAQVETTNYVTYIHNLRAIGCPEQTIRDIITADVHAIYAQQGSRMCQGAPARFWLNPGVAAAEAEREAARLEFEERQVLEQLLPASNPGAEPCPAVVKTCGVCTLDDNLRAHRGEIEAWWQRWELTRAELFSGVRNQALDEVEQPRSRMGSRGAGR